MKRSTVQTVLGPLPTADVGATLTHEHLISSATGVESDVNFTFDYEGELLKGIARMKELRTYGVSTIIDPIPMDLGRKVDFMADVSQASGIKIVCATGLYRETGWLSGYPTYYKLKRTEDLTEIFSKEITEGIGPRKIKPGVIKCATSEGQITDNERKALTAAARASKATGTPITTHTENGTMGPEQLDIFEHEGIDPRDVTIGHCSDSANLGYLLKIVKRGAFVGFDRIGMEAYMHDDIKLGVIAALVGLGYEKQIVLSHDHVGCAHGMRMPRAAQPKRRFTYIHEEFIPRLRGVGVTEKAINTMLVDNPRRFFEGS